MLRHKEPAGGGRWLVAVLAFVLWAVAPARAGDSLFVVTGVPVDVTAGNAAEAKDKALGEVQVTAFRMLAERLGGPEAAAKAARFDLLAVGRLLKSLSVEEEHTAPGRYFGKLTVRFLPDKTRKAFASAGITWSEERAPRIVIVPVWKGENGATLWDDNVWRRAWLSLGAENSLVPLLVPLGDLTDAQTVSVEEVLAGNPLKLEGIRLRYQGEALLVAVAEPAGEKSVHAVMSGQTPLGLVQFDKTYSAEEGGIEAAAVVAAKRFHAVMTERWKSTHGPASAPVAATQSMSIAIPFASADEWNMIRSGLLATPGVSGVDISTLAQGGAVVTLTYAGPFQDLQAALRLRGLNLQLLAGGWVLQPF
jgi:hypothetical protein